MLRSERSSKYRSSLNAGRPLLKGRKEMEREGASAGVNPQNEVLGATIENTHTMYRKSANQESRLT